MNIGQVKTAYQGHKDTPCLLTEKLIKSGYQQVSGGYINRAHSLGMIVDYKQARPTQWWHLMSYCESRTPEHPFTRTVVCGELIFWMGEVSGLISGESLESLVNRIISDNNANANRKKWNKAIQDVCFDGIKKYVENYAKAVDANEHNT